MLKKLLFKEIKYMGAQCPFHHPRYATEDHISCIKKWEKAAQEEYENSFEYKQTEIINALIDELNTKST